MATSSRPKAPSFTTPRGVMKYPKLNEPDTKFKADGEYAVKLVLPAQDAATQALIAKLVPLHEAAMSNAAREFAGLAVAARKKLGKVSENALYNEVYDEATEEPTGDIEFNFKMQASGTYKTGKKTGERWTRKPDIFDAKGKLLTGKLPAIWSGSEGKVSFEVGLNKEGEPGYFVPATGAAGLSLRLQGVQVLKLVSGSARDASGYGFQAEDGYEAGEPDGDTPSYSTDDVADAGGGDVPTNGDF